MDESSCQTVRIISTFPWIFVIIFFIFGFTCSLIGCLLINHTSYLRFIPFLTAVIFEIVLAPLVGLLKSYHLQYLHSELNESINCIVKIPATTSSEDNEVDFDEKNYLKSLNYVQKKFNCCGVNSVQDWKQNHHAVPKSCCAHMKFNCTLDTLKEKIGCYEAVQMDVFSNWNAMIMFIIVFICIKLIMLIMYKCSEISRSSLIHPALSPTTHEIVDKTLTQHKKHSGI